MSRSHRPTLTAPDITVSTSHNSTSHPHDADTSQPTCSLKAGAAFPTGRIYITRASSSNIRHSASPVQQRKACKPTLTSNASAHVVPTHLERRQQTGASEHGRSGLPGPGSPRPWAPRFLSADAVEWEICFIQPESHAPTASTYRTQRIATSRSATAQTFAAAETPGPRSPDEPHPGDTKPHPSHSHRGCQSTPSLAPPPVHHTHCRTNTSKSASHSSIVGSPVTSVPISAKWDISIAPVIALVTGHFGQDPFRPYFLAETSLKTGTFRPRNMDVSAKKYGRFGLEIGTFRPRNMDVSAKKYGLLHNRAQSCSKTTSEVARYIKEPPLLPLSVSLRPPIVIDNNVQFVVVYKYYVTTCHQTFWSISATINLSSLVLKPFQVILPWE